MIMLLTPPRLDGVLGTGYPTPVNGVIIRDTATEYTGGPGRFVVGGFRFDGITTDSGVLQELVGTTGYAAVDNVQWHEDQPSTTASAYAIRAKGVSYTGPATANVFEFDGQNLRTTYFGTFTPWQRMSTNNNDLSVGNITSGNTAVGVATIEIGPWPTGGAAYMSADFTVTYIFP